MKQLYCVIVRSPAIELHNGTQFSDDGKPSNMSSGDAFARNVMLLSSHQQKSKRRLFTVDETSTDDTPSDDVERGEKDASQDDEFRKKPIWRQSTGVVAPERLKEVWEVWRTFSVRVTSIWRPT